MQTFAERFKQARKEIGKTQQELAESLGVSRNYITLIENGSKEPSDRLIKDLCNKYNMSYDWLQYGEGEMLTDDGDAQAIIDRVMTSDNQFAKDVLLKFARLDDKYWDMIEEIIDTMKE